MQSEIRQCQNCKKDFTIEPEDFNFYEKMKVPAPTFCPLCRAQRRWAFRNERGLYKRKCDFSGKEIFSMYAPDSPVKVYDRDIWLSDAWDPTSYGKEIDWSKPFLEQVHELWKKVPLRSNNVINGVNSDYVNNATDPKNCYLIFNTNWCEDCMYSNGIDYCKDCVDISHSTKAESSYQSFWITSSYRTHYSSQCADSSDLWFCRDCVGCMNCFGCVNLVNKSYCFFNQQLSKGEYEQKIKIYKLYTRSGVGKALEESRDFWEKFPYRSVQGIKNVNCDGSYITHSRNVHDSFLIRGGENLRYCQYLQAPVGTKDSYDYSNWGEGAELMYEVIISGASVQNIKFSVLTQESTHNAEYTISCRACENIFGCVSLQKKQYCILNKQYSKEEYEKLTPKIRKHMIDMPFIDKKGRIYKYGEFFPIEFSPWAYNETIAQEYFPLTEDKTIENGYKWRNPNIKEYIPTLFAEDIPEDIYKVEDSITSEIFECAHKLKCNHNCTKAFRVTNNELNFYKKIGLPLPVLCPACRTIERLKLRLGVNLYKQKCMCAGSMDDSGIYKNTIKHFHNNKHCSEEFKTGYLPNSKSIIYCEKCYQQEVY